MNSYLCYYIPFLLSDDKKKKERERDSVNGAKQIIGENS